MEEYQNKKIIIDGNSKFGKFFFDNLIRLYEQIKPVNEMKHDNPNKSFQKKIQRNDRKL